MSRLPGRFELRNPSNPAVWAANFRVKSPHFRLYWIQCFRYREYTVSLIDFRFRTSATVKDPHRSELAATPSATTWPFFNPRARVSAQGQLPTCSSAARKLNQTTSEKFFMPKSLLLIVCSLAICAPAAFAGVTVTSPANGASVSGTVAYAASATSSCSKGVATMGIYTAPGVLAYVSNGSTLKTSLTLSSATYYTTA